jgi:pimeloyl-ACP methyl ester carboxylesterase
VSVEQRHTGPFPPMPPAPESEYGSPRVRREVGVERAQRRAAYRSRWWFPLVLLLVVLSGFWEMLKADQLLADQLVWPTRGAQFVEVGPVPEDPEVTGGRILIVAGGLNRKSGTGPAAALMPALTVGHTRVFSLVYGSGISDHDLLDKYDALIDRLRPREVSFFGSSMGGDVVLNLAAHAQQGRDGYREQLLAAAVAATRAGSAAAAGSPDAAGGGQVPGEPAAAGATGGTDGAGGPGSEAGSGSAAGSGDGSAGGGADGPGTGSPADPPLLQRNDVVGAQAGDLTSVLVLPDGSVVAPAGTGVAGLITAGGSLARTPPTAPSPVTTGTPSDLPASGRTSGSTSPQSPGDAVPPRLGVIYLDCSPLSPQDVRDESRTQADVLTTLTESLDTDGGAGVRMLAEVLAQQQQWSSGRMPFVDVRWPELTFKIRQVWRDKINSPGISTQLVKDQYGVIRRMHIDDVAQTLGPGIRIVYFHPVDPDDDHTVRVDRVQSALATLAEQVGLSVRFVAIPGGHHASAETNADQYRAAIDALNGTGGI